LIRAAFRGSSIFERHSLRRFAARVDRSHRRDLIAHRTRSDDRSYGRDVGDRSSGRDIDHVDRVAHDMSACHGRHAATLLLKRNSTEDAREALMMLLDFLLGSSIDDIAASRRSSSRAHVEEALRSVLLEYGFTASQERRS
jgi:hypothetical protein